MKAQKLWRKIHYWLAPVVLVPLGIVILTGVLLLLKKEFAWIQPPTQKSQFQATAPQQTFAELYARAEQIAELELTSWSDLDRVDVKPNKGVVKFVANNRWEAQIDVQTGEVLQVAYRRSDFIESLHDGSFFAGWTKLYIFLPSAILLLILWGSGIYLFILTQLAQQRKRSHQRGKKSHQRSLL